MRKFICIISPIIVGIVTILSLNNFLDSNINAMLEKKDLTDINMEYGSMYKDKGVTYNNYLIKNNSIILQATSELNVPVEQVPTKFFNGKGIDNIVTIGRQGSQDLTQLTILGSNSDDEKRRVALIVSIQWFYNKDGVAPSNFQGNFAPVQFYNFLDNKNISNKNKKKYSVRVNHVLNGTTQFAPEKLYAKIYSSDSKLIKAAGSIFKPYFYLRKNIVQLKDKGLLYKKLKNLPEKDEEQVKEINWKEEYKKAEEQGKSKITNNNFMVYDQYYNSKKKDMESTKNSLKNTNLMASKEFDDYELYLDTCKDLNIEPYIILMPTNGKWYDYLGLDKSKRDEFYNRAEELAKDRGFKVLNFKDEEYTPYFMCDAAHFGWKGWLKVDEELYEYFKEQ